MAWDVVTLHARLGHQGVAHQDEDNLFSWTRHKDTKMQKHAPINKSLKSSGYSALREVPASCIVQPRQIKYKLHLSARGTPMTVEDPEQREGRCVDALNPQVFHALCVY